MIKPKILLYAAIYFASCTSQENEIEQRIKNICKAEKTTIFESKTENENNQSIYEIAVEIKNPKILLAEGAKSNQIASSSSFLLYNSINKTKLEEKDYIKIVITTPNDPFGLNNSFQYPITNLASIDSLYRIAINIAVNSSLGQSFVSNRYLNTSIFNDSLLDIIFQDFKGIKISKDNFQFNHFTFNESVIDGKISIFFLIEFAELNKMYRIDFDKKTYKVDLIVTLR